MCIQTFAKIRGWYTWGMVGCGTNVQPQMIAEKYSTKVHFNLFWWFHGLALLTPLLTALFMICPFLALDNDTLLYFTHQPCWIITFTSLSFSTLLRYHCHVAFSSKLKLCVALPLPHSCQWWLWSMAGGTKCTCHLLIDTWGNANRCGCWLVVLAVTWEVGRCMTTVTVPFSILWSSCVHAPPSWAVHSVPRLWFSNCHQTPRSC